jgi:nucleotide-binding universal stress UspA family protein
VDLIAMATHGRGGLPRLFLGSVADKVLRGCHTPLLVYRPLREAPGSQTTCKPKTPTGS